MHNKSFCPEVLQLALVLVIFASKFLCATTYSIDGRKVHSNATELEPPILEYHFHTYFDANDPVQVAQAIELRNEIITNCVTKKIIAVPQRYRYNPENPVLEHKNDTSGLSMRPVGPHPVAQFQTWVPVEYFAKMYEWFIQKRSPLTVLIHPLSPHEVLDHTVRAVFMGKSFDLNTGALREVIPNLASEQPHLKLGYAKPRN